MVLLLCHLVNRGTCKSECILLNNEQGNKVNSQRSFSCISVDFSGEDQQPLFLSLPNSIRFCAAVKLGSGETEEKSIRVPVWPLIFSLLPSFSPHLHHPFPPLFLLSQLVRSGQSILTPSTGQVRTSNIPWIHSFSPSPATCTQVTATHSPALSPPSSSNHTSISHFSPSVFLYLLFPLSLSVMAYNSFCPFAQSHCPLNAWRILTFRQRIT